MKRLAFILFAFTALGALAQGSVNKDMAKLVSSAINRGVDADGVYCIDNSKNKLITVEQAEQYLRDKGYFPAVSTSKTIIRFGQEQTVVDRVKFSDENGYAKFVFDKLKGGNYRYVNYSQLKTGGTFFYTVRVNRGLLPAKYSEFADNNRIVNVSWSGNMEDGLPDGKGVGMYKITTPERIEYVVFEGEFVTGIPTTQLTVKKTDNSTFTLGGYKIYNGDEEDNIRKGLIFNSYNKDASPLLKKALKGYLTQYFEDDCKKINEIFNTALTINTLSENFTVRPHLELVTYRNLLISMKDLFIKGKYIITDNGKSIEIGRRDGFMAKTIQQYEDKDVGLQDSKINELRKLYDVLDVLGHYMDPNPDGTEDEDSFYKSVIGFRDNYFKALESTRNLSQSTKSSFKPFYEKAYERLLKKESYFRDEYVRKTMQLYYISRKSHYAKMCDKCRIDGDRSTVPTGYVPKEENFFTTTPAHSEKNGVIRMVNGEFILWSYEYDDNDNIKFYKIKPSGLLTLEKYSFDNKEAMMDAIIEACKKKYCE